MANEFMLIILFVFLVGIVLGYCIRARARLLRWVARMSNIALYSLLFILGLSLGVDDSLMANLPHIGLNALFLALGAIGMSLGCCYVFSKYAAGGK